MRKLLEDFYDGNLAPDEQIMASDSELRQAVGRAADCEDRLIKRLDKAEQNILEELIDAQHLMDNITARENFILGFRLGVRMMAECMDYNDGYLQRVTANI